MIVGDHITVLRDHEAGALCERGTRRRRATTAVAELARQIAEELVQRMIIGKIRHDAPARCVRLARARWCAPCHPLAAVRDVDAHDRGLNLLDEIGEAQRRAAERCLNGLCGVGALLGEDAELRRGHESATKRGGDRYSGDRPRSLRRTGLDGC